MDWLGIGLAAGSGALAASLAYLIVRRPARRRAAYVVLALLLFFGFKALSDTYILNPARQERAERELMDAVADIPIYRSVARYDRQEYERLMVLLREEVSRGAGREAVISRARDLAGGLAVKYLPRASNEAAVGYFRVFVTALEQLELRDPELCYRFVFPGDGAAVDPHDSLDQETRNADVQALVEVIRTASQKPRPVPTQKAADTILAPVFAALYREHGEDVEVLQKPQEPDTDHAKVCTLIKAFYREILDLPVDPGGVVLRYLFAGT